MIGAHLSIGKGIHSLQKQMELLKCDCCAMFLKSQRQYNSKQLSENEIKEFKNAIKFPERLIPHGSYLINLANPDTCEKSLDCLLDDLKRCEALGLTLYNIHPGSDVKNLGNKALDLIAENLNIAIKKTSNVIICLENMAGQGTVCGRTFSELKYIIDRVIDKNRIGVTLDTCHLFGGGYDIRTPENFTKIMDEFKTVVGIEYLKALHLNDSKCELNSRKDRHESIGEGKIGIDAFKFIMNSDDFEDIPMILETPFPENFKKEIELLKSLSIEN